MALTPINLLVDALADATASTVAAEVTTHGVRAATGRFYDRGRPERLSIYNAFLHDALLARYRLQVMLDIHAAQYDPRAIVAALTGFPVLAGLLERLTEDLAQLTHSWRLVSQVGSVEAESAAEELILALVARMSSTDPGWHRPIRRSRQRRTVEGLNRRLNLALRRVELAATADAAPDRATRRTATQDLLDLLEMSGIPATNTQ